ncbi:hypothetical protein Tco_1374903, partial [Tanacetum coccineum]
MLRQRCNSGEEHQYHVDQMQNFIKSDIFWESRKERLTLPTPKKKASVVHNYQRDPKSPPMTLLNQDLFYLKHDNSGLKKYILSLHKYSVDPFPDDDIEEQTSRWIRANERPPMLEKGNYIPWESRFKRFLDNNLKEGDQMWRSIEKGPYNMPMIPNPDNTNEQILEPLSKIIEGIKKPYIA